MPKKANTYVITYSVKGSNKKNERMAIGYSAKEEKIKMIKRNGYKVISVKIQK
jgi:uncharacterized protein YpmB